MKFFLLFDRRYHSKKLDKITNMRNVSVKQCEILVSHKTLKNVTKLTATHPYSHPPPLQYFPPYNYRAT